MFLGVFPNKKQPAANIRTSMDRIMEALIAKEVGALYSSSSGNRWMRLLEQLYSVVAYRSSYKVAVLPLFGTSGSIYWHRVLSALVRIVRKRLVVTVNGGSIPKQIESGNSRFFKMMNCADFVICPSKFMYDIVKRYPLKNIYLIENSIKIEDYPFETRKHIRPVLIWMRAFEDCYNPLMAIRVAALLKQKYWDCKLIMAGKDGPLLSVVTEEVERNGLTENVLFPGYLSMEDKIFYARQASIFLCTNYIDNAPVSLIEFMALGTVVVATDAGGICELIEDGQTGYMVKADDDHAMFSRIDMLLQNPASYFKTAASARKKSLHYDSKILADKWVALLQ